MTAVPPTPNQMNVAVRIGGAQHHQLVLASGREPGSPSSGFQMSFKVTSIDELRTLRSCAVERGASHVIAMNHGDPLDLDLPDDTIWQQTEDVCRADPTFLPADEWARRFGESPRRPATQTTPTD